MTGSPDSTSADSDSFLHWRRNLGVAVFGSSAIAASMTLVLPFLPLYIEQLGIEGQAAIAQWSGLAYSASFLGAGLMAPLWGRVADRYGRKLMMVRAGLAAAIIIGLTGMAQTALQFVALRLLAGLFGGYYSAAIILVAAQTPRARSAWALGTLSSGMMVGSLTGPLIGGAMPPLFGIRATFIVASAAILIALAATVLLVREAPRASIPTSNADRKPVWRHFLDNRPVVILVAVAGLLVFAHSSVDPLMALYVAEIVPDAGQVTLVAGLVMSAAAFGAALSAPRVGRLGDRIGHWTVIGLSLSVCAILLLPQAAVTQSWQLIVLRFLTGLSIGGILPCISSLIRDLAPERASGQMLGYLISAQHVGNMTGPLVGGYIGGHYGMRTVLLGASLVLVLGALTVWSVKGGRP